MSVKRYYYSDTISDFIQKEKKAIVGELALAYSHASMKKLKDPGLMKYE